MAMSALLMGVVASSRLAQGIGVGYFQITIPATGVGSDLTDFPVLVNLADTPSSFWPSTNVDGGNIRVYATVGGAEYPIDVASFQWINETGSLWVKVPTLFNAADTTFVIVPGAISLSRYARNATYGAAAVWSGGYHSVFLGADNTDDHASTSRIFNAQGDVASFLNVGNPEKTFADDPHQGITWERSTGDIWTVDNNKIVRYSAAGATLATNSNPSGQVESALAMATLGHCCDLCVVGDYIIVPINNYPTDTLCAIATFDKETLALVSATDVSVTEPEISGICWNPDESRLVTCNWGTFTRFNKFTLNLGTGVVAFSSFTTITLVGGGSLANAIQGIEYWRGHYWLSDDTRDEVIRAQLNGTVNYNDCPMQFDDNSSGSVAGNYEGLCVYKDGLGVLIDPTSANSYMIYSRPVNFLMGGGGGRWGTNDGYFQATGLTGSTTFTMAISAARSALKQQAMVSYRDFSSGDTNDRVTLSHRLVSGSYRLECWDNINTWLSPASPISPITGGFDRVVVVYAGTTRTLYVNGIQVATQAGITARDAGFTAFSLGIDDTSLLESFDGSLAFGYISHTAKSAAWIAAEYAMINNPAAFMTITGG